MGNFESFETPLPRPGSILPPHLADIRTLKKLFKSCPQGYCQAWTVTLAFYASLNDWDYRHAHYTQLLSIEMGSREVYCLRLQSLNLSLLSSQNFRQESPSPASNIHLNMK
jgi:hypothetical protein